MRRALMLALVGGACCGWGAAWGAPIETGPTVLDELPEPFVPLKPRSEAEESRLEALSLFAAGRMAESSGRFQDALRLYQRALRLDARSTSVMWRVVAVAERLGRKAEMIRYALRAVELDPSDPSRLRSLAEALSEQGDFESARKLYEQLRKQEQAQRPRGPAYVLLTLELGRLCLLSGHEDEAADAFSEVLDALEHPDRYGLQPNLQRAILGERGRNLIVFGEALLAAERPEAALAAFERAERESPQAARHAYRVARVRAAQDQAAAALEELEKYLAAGESAEGVGPYRLLARLLSELGREDQLVGRLERLAALESDNVPLQFFLAEQYREQRRYDRAEPIYRRLLDEAASAEIYAGMAATLRAQQKYEALLDLLAEVIEKSDGLEAVDDEAQAVAQNAAALNALIAVARGRPSEGRQRLRAPACSAVALLALEAKRFGVAREFFERALDQQPDNAAQLVLAWGLGLLVESRYAGAADVLRRGISEQLLPRENPTFHYYLTTALALQGKTDEALQAAREAIALGEETVRLESRIPWILYHAKRYDEAHQEYVELVERYRDDFETEEVRDVLREARLILSNICVIQDDIPQAEEWLEQVLDEFPDDPSALNDLGYLWADQEKNLERALEMTQQAVAAEPDNAAYRDSLGWALYRVGRHEEALAELRQAVASGETDPVIYDHLGDILLALGRDRQAVTAWRQALAAFTPDHSEPERKSEIEAKLARHGAAAEEGLPLVAP